MVKMHTWYTVQVNYETIQYFYIREKSDRNGNPRYRVYVIDPDLVVYESILKCYEYEIEDQIIAFCESGEF